MGDFFRLIVCFVIAIIAYYVGQASVSTQKIYKSAVYKVDLVVDGVVMAQSNADSRYNEGFAVAVAGVYHEEYKDGIFSNGCRIEKRLLSDWK